MVVLIGILLIGFLCSPGKAHESNQELKPLAGQYSVVAETEQIGENSWVFRYIITNLTAEGDWTTPPLSGLPAWMQGIDFTGLSNFFVRVPRGAAISNVQLPQSYGATHGSFSPDNIHEWVMQGPWQEPGDDLYAWIMIYPYGIFEIYPRGATLIFSFQIDGVAVGTNEGRISTYYPDHWVRYDGDPDRAKKVNESYTFQMTSPVPLAVKAWKPMVSGTSRDLLGVWGSASDNVFAVGQQGTILRYDGASWSQMASGTTMDLNAVWGSSASNVYAVGGTYDMSSGHSGIILKYNGSSWNPIYTDPGFQYYGVWGSSPDDVFAVGSGGRIVHYNGFSWTPMPSGTGGAGLTAVWGTGPQDVFAVGYTGNIVRYDGSSWAKMASGTTSVLRGIWGAGTDNVFAVGENGALLHFNGLSWSPMSGAGTNSLIGVWGSSAANVFATGFSPRILDYDGSALDSTLSGAYYALLGIWGSSWNDIFAVGAGGTIVHTGGMSITAYSPVDITVIDPDGLVISKTLNQIPGATYEEEDLNGDSDPDDRVNIPLVKIGKYKIQIVPKPGASSMDTYTLEASIAGDPVTLAKDAPVGGIPAKGYSVSLIADIFSDVPISFWAYDYILEIYNAQITAGCSQDPPTYCPENQVTREQMAVFIIRAMDEGPTEECGADPFSDVSADRWSCKYIKRLGELGITSEYGDGRFGPEDPVTREQMAVFITRARASVPPDGYCGTTDPFTDVPFGHWSCKYVKKFLELGITTGYGDGRFGPTDFVTRGQMAVFLARAFLIL
jgi:hypothetical protein